MKKLIIISSLLLSVIAMNAQSNPRSTTTRGYVKKNGTYVEPSHRTSPNRTQRDNYSSKGNVNPYTGKTGTKKPRK